MFLNSWTLTVLNSIQTLDFLRHVELKKVLKVTAHLKVLEYLRSILVSTSFWMVDLVHVTKFTTIFPNGPNHQLLVCTSLPCMTFHCEFKQIQKRRIWSIYISKLI